MLSIEHARPSDALLEQTKQMGKRHGRQLGKETIFYPLHRQENYIFLHGTYGATRINHDAGRWPLHT